MKYLVPFCTLLLAACTNEDTQRQWNEAMRDARGENMEMRNDFSTPRPVARKGAPRPVEQNDD